MPSPKRPWSTEHVQLQPLVLLRGGEEYLVARLEQRLLHLARERDPNVEVTNLDAASYEAGSLAVVTSASLFEEPRLVFAREAERGSDDFFADVAAYAASPAPEATLVIVHLKGTRGKKTLEALAAAGAVQYAGEPIKREEEKARFAEDLAAEQGRRLGGGAAAALVDALGNDLRELASGVLQVLADVPGNVDSAAVHEYYGGRQETTGFAVADAAVAGDAAKAIVLLRRALSTGADPIPIAAALAAKLRALAKVAALRSGMIARAQLQLAPWQIERAQRELKGWNGPALGQAIVAVANADAALKGEGKDPVYAIERAVLAVAQRST